MRHEKRLANTMRTASRVGALLLGCLAGQAALGRDGNVFTPYAGLNLTMDNNLFRLPADVNVASISGKGERGDVISSFQAGLRGDRFVGRQRLLFDVSINQTRYRTYSYLNANLLNGSGTWAWQFGHHLSGEIGSEYIQALTGFNDVRSAARNVTSTRSDRATADYMLHPDWHLVGGLYQVTQDNSAAERIAGNFVSEAVEGGISYVPVSGNHMSLRARGTRATYANSQFLFGVPISNDYSQTDLTADAYWQISGHSQLSGLLGYTRRHYPDFQQRDYTGPTGRVTWGWQATGKTLLNLELKRELGAYQDTTNNYIVTDGVSISTIYQASAKTQWQGRLEDKTRRFLGDPGFVFANIERRVDHTKTASLTWGYDVAWPLHLSTALQREWRTSNTAGFSYIDTSATLSMQLTW